MCMCKLRINDFCYQSSATISYSDYIWPSRMWSGNEAIFTIPANRCGHFSKFLNLLFYDLEYGSYTLDLKLNGFFLLFFHCPCLPQVPEYAVLEKDSAPMPISTSLQSSASLTLTSLPPPLSSSPPSCMFNAPTSIPPSSLILTATTSVQRDFEPASRSVYNSEPVYGNSNCWNNNLLDYHIITYSFVHAVLPQSPLIFWSVYYIV